MPFNIPIPEDRSGEMIGQGLANAMLAYRQARENKTFRAEHEQDRAHMLQAQSLDDAIRQSSARQAGITPGTAPQENLDLPVYDRMPASTDHLPFDTAMQPHPEGLSEALRGRMNTAASSGFPLGASAGAQTGGAPSVASMTMGGAQRLLGQGEDRPASVAATTPGAFSVEGGGFHSPLKDQMGGAAGVSQAGAPAGAPMSRQPQGGGAPVNQPSRTLRMAPSYQQLTPDYYLDRTAPGPVGSALAAALGREKTEAEIGELGARGNYYREHGDYFAQGGAVRPGQYRIVQGKDGYYRVNLADPTDVQPLAADGTPIAPRTPARNRQVIQTEQGDFFVNDDGSIEPVSYGGKQLQPRAGTRSVGAEPPDVTSTRRDLRDIQGQQIRAENQAKALKGEQRAFAAAHPRVNRGLPAARTAADTAAVQDYNELGAQIDSAQSRAGRLTRSADSTLSVLQQRRTNAGAATLPIGGTGGSAPAPSGMPSLQNRFDAEAQNYKAATDRIRQAVNDPAEQKRRLDAASAIYNGRVAKIANGQDPDAGAP